MSVCLNCAGRRRVGVPSAPCPTCNGTGELADEAGSPSPYGATLHLNGGQRLYLDQGKSGASHRPLPGGKKV